jgi:starvation-inducible outer membrane lipoprotein
MEFSRKNLELVQSVFMPRFLSVSKVRFGGVIFSIQSDFEDIILIIAS